MGTNFLDFEDIARNLLSCQEAATGSAQMASQVAQATLGHALTSPEASGDAAGKNSGSGLVPAELDAQTGHLFSNLGMRLNEAFYEAAQGAFGNKPELGSAGQAMNPPNPQANSMNGPGAAARL